MASFLHLKGENSEVKRGFMIYPRSFSEMRPVLSHAGSQVLNSTAWEKVSLSSVGSHSRKQVFHAHVFRLWRVNADNSTYMGLKNTGCISARNVPERNTKFLFMQVWSLTYPVLRHHLPLMSSFIYFPALSAHLSTLANKLFLCGLLHFGQNELCSEL